MLRMCMPIRLKYGDRVTGSGVADNVIARPAAVDMMASPLCAWVEVAGKIVQGSARVSVQGLPVLS